MYTQFDEENLTNNKFLEQELMDNIKMDLRHTVRTQKDRKGWNCAKLGVLLLALTNISTCCHRANSISSKQDYNICTMDTPLP
jgi:hypothetical protein